MRPGIAKRVPPLIDSTFEKSVVNEETPTPVKYPQKLEDVFSVIAEITTYEDCSPIVLHATTWIISFKLRFIGFKCWFTSRNGCFSFLRRAAANDPLAHHCLIRHSR